jgi:hypothetical protein
MLVRASILPLRTRPRVQRAPGIPCALFFEGELLASLGRIAPRDRKVMSAIERDAF